jgi:hypothetical protein
VRYLNGEAGGDVKFIWEMNRHQQLVRLAQAYYLTKEERYAAVLAQLLSAWIDQNPPGVGINWVSSLEVAIRAIAWCWCWHLTKDAPIWDDERLALFLGQLWHHAHHVERFDSIHHSPNTHLTGEALGLLYVGRCFPLFDRAARWRACGLDTLRSEIDYQILADGMHYERSTGYHRYTLECYLHAYVLARSEPSELAQFRSVLPRLAEVSRALRRDDGTWPVLGDEDGGRLLRLGDAKPTDHDPLLAIAAALFDRPAWAAGDDKGVDDEAWWLVDEEEWGALAAWSMERGQPAWQDAALADAGYYVARDRQPGRRWYCLVDGGPHGGKGTGHAHSDLAHVEIAYGDRHLVSDPGCPSYTADPLLRDWFRSERAHACLCADDFPMAIPNGPFSWYEVCGRPEVTLHDDGALSVVDVEYSRDTGNAFLQHKRQVVLVRGFGIAVYDSVVTSAPTALELRWPIPLAPAEIRMSAGDRSARACVGPATIEWFWPAAATPPRVTLVTATSSASYGEQRPSSIVALRSSAAQALSMTTCFAADNGSWQPVVIDDQHIILAIVQGARRRELVLRHGTTPVLRLPSNDSR